MATNMIAESAPTQAEFCPEGTAAKVWEALHANPAASITTIAEAAGVSRPTATKALAGFAEAGRAVRTPGGRTDKGRALPDTWASVPSVTQANADAPVSPEINAEALDTPDVPTDTPTTSDVPDAAAQDDSGVPDDTSATTPAMSIQDAMRILEQEADRRAIAEVELARAQAEEEARRQQAAEALAKARMIEDSRRALTDLLNAVTTTYAALLADDETAFTTGLEAIYAGTTDVRKAARITQAKTNGSTATWGSSRGDRNAPRPLRPDVLTHLIKHPDLAFTANEIAKVLKRSSGAVANALDTLAKNGEAELVSERPNRFRVAKPEDA
ncbi:hypothetical protein E1267_39355 [Nonomuraea longispora]|uniref:Uncharacterized protein n=1 Tax=Nonomuraea longispora TaxID=1848320 RepID=A0A4R4MPF7_9ACTN|nr:hypothetical protein [Nonomuraea longispora]TDB97888.1 hypothetical protein E1267_39355 [Nonomuraea longispora]